uniref:Uncharacterized protein n=1 Tax=Meloidogyne incognita TaxID=6306 RepID=A0A914LF63_MELIC
MRGENNWMGSINGERTKEKRVLFPFSITSRSLQMTASSTITSRSLQMTASSTSDKVLRSRPVLRKVLGGEVVLSLLLGLVSVKVIMGFSRPTRFTKPDLR